MNNEFSNKHTGDNSRATRTRFESGRKGTALLKHEGCDRPKGQIKTNAKRSGAGAFNWGQPGDELKDIDVDEIVSSD